MRETNRSFDSCNSCKRLVPSRLYEYMSYNFRFDSSDEISYLLLPCLTGPLFFYAQSTWLNYTECIHLCFRVDRDAVGPANVVLHKDGARRGVAIHASTLNFWLLSPVGPEHKPANVTHSLVVTYGVAFEQYLSCSQAIMQSVV